VKKVNLKQRTLGINFPDKREAKVCVWAPLAEKVELLLKKSNKIISLLKDDYGYWNLSTNELLPHDPYLFVLDGEKERSDPASLYQPEGVHGFSEAIDLNDFPWTDSEWINPLLEEYIIYELHTGTFTQQGTFKGIEEKLAYLKLLGITAIEIMPVSQFPGNRNWGYDGVFPFAVQNSYGGATGLMHLVDTCHQKGIAVILDVVYNHLGPEGNYFSDFGPYFTNKYNTPWGDAINFDDAYCDAIRHYFIENALMWLRDFHIDALRIDAVHAIKDFSPTHILQEIKTHVNQLIKETGRNQYLIVELDLNDTRFINPLEKNGYGMDAQWIDEFHHALRVTAGGEKRGYYSDFNGIQHLAKAYTDAYVYDGMYSPHRLKTFGTRTVNPGKQFVVFSQNHDQVGNRMLGERSSQLVSFEMQKVLAGAVLASPFIPMLFMGEEWAEPHPFLYFVSHTDPELAKAVREGRKREFSEFQEQNEMPDPLDTETYQRSKLQWELIDQDPYQIMLKFYQSLITIRKQLPALATLNRQHIQVSFDESNNTLTLLRWHANQKVCCLLNFSQTKQTLFLPDALNHWNKVLDSADPKWKGPLAAPDQVNASSALSVQPESFVIYTTEHA